MRLIDFFPEASISVKNAATSWQEAIDFCMAPLLRHGIVNEDYIKAIKESTENNGPYYILIPGVALPHARPECGALKTGLSLTLLKNEVHFGENNEPVRLLIGLAASDSNAHIGAIQSLSELLCEDEHLSALLEANTEQQLTEILSRV
ncbi:PTS mannitol transporter subunit IIA [Jinshanibacter sp. LJY008]|uniref:PTS mannitol transporter subunit IIA n=1 Tax=Limnobaculum eriocheiris TaxID=2897391 RepID=A0A9X1MXL4_9GAMM|nr:PTS mannitol transporter subunit IIA [Limnobaculum eriocheiris]MCD1126460.1 PTS mannitol transporter subunit IIA [Limnobaculum eriocheiris]